MTLNEVIERHMLIEFDTKQNIEHPQDFISNLDTPEEAESVLNILRESLEYTQIALTALEEKRDREAVDPCEQCDETYYKYDSFYSYTMVDADSYIPVDCKYCPMCGRLLTGEK